MYMHLPRDSPYLSNDPVELWRNQNIRGSNVAINQPIEEEIEDVQEITDIHVSLVQRDNIVEEGRYRLYFRDKKLVQAKSGNQGAQLTFAFDADRHPQYEKRTQRHTFYFTENAMWRYTKFLVACKINPEMLREEETGEVVNGKPVTKCVYSVNQQLESIIGAAVYGDIANEEYTRKALVDGFPDEVHKVSKIVDFTPA